MLVAVGILGVSMKARVGKFTTRYDNSFHRQLWAVMKGMSSEQVEAFE